MSPSTLDDYEAYFRKGLDLSFLKDSIVPGEKPELSFGRKSNLAEHLRMLHFEFVGQPILLFFHAYLIVLLRRGLALHENVTRFSSLWTSEVDFLTSRLNSRWLVAACDTIIDHYEDRGERATALCGTLLLSTVKLYETEALKRTVQGDWNDAGSHGPIELFDGITAFSVKQGDLVYNLARRVRAVCSEETTASRIVAELFRRVNDYSTVYARFRALNQNESVRW